MWTRRDQMQAYQFLRRRLVSALVFRAANHWEAPSRRVVIALVTGLGLSLVVMAGFGVYGLFVPGRASAWTAGDRVIVEKETGALFVLDSEETLRPVLNFASAALFLSTGRPEVDVVSQSSLQVRPRGPAIGIVGAPPSVPESDALVDGPWTACSRISLGVGGTPDPEVTLLVGADVEATPLADDGALLVSDATTGEVFLLQGGTAHLVESDAVARAFGYATDASVPTGPAWLSTVPRGAALRFFDVPDAAGTALADRATRAGQVFTVDRGEGRTELVAAWPDGLAPVSAAEAELLLDDLANPGRPADGLPVPLAAGVVAAAPASTTFPHPDLPDELGTPVELAADDVSLCADAGAEDDATPTLSWSATDPVPEGWSRVPGPDDDGAAPLADVVSVAPGRGSFVQERVAGGAGLGTTYLVTDEGRRYPLGAEDAASFGYDGDDLAEAPKAFTALLPVGPALSAAAAAEPAPVPAPPGPVAPGPGPGPTVPPDDGPVPIVDAPRARHL